MTWTVELHSGYIWITPSTPNPKNAPRIGIAIAVAIEVIVVAILVITMDAFGQSQSRLREESVESFSKICLHIP